MSGPLKKARAVYPLEEYVPDDDEEEEMEDEFVGQVIDVDFDAFKAEDSDYHGIKRLLNQSFRNLDVDTTGIADIIISQNYIGSVVKQVSQDDDDEDEEDIMEDEEEIYGVSTIINLTSRKDEEPVSKLRSSLVEECQKSGSDSTNTFLREILSNESKHVGLLISERLVNLPPQFAMPVYESLIKEMEEAKKKGMAYDFTYLIINSKICKREATKTKKNKNNPNQNQADLIWSNPEEEIFYEECRESFEFKLKGDTALTGDWNDDDAQYSQWRRVLIIEAKKLSSILCKVREAISQN